MFNDQSGGLPLEAHFEIDAHINKSVAMGLHVLLTRLTGELADNAEQLADRWGNGQIDRAFLPLAESCYSVVQTMMDPIGAHGVIAQRAIDAVAAGVPPEPQQSMQLTSMMSALSDMLELVSTQIALPIRQWRVETAAAEIKPDRYPLAWRIGVRLGSIWYALEDLAEIRQCCAQLLGLGTILETRRWAGAVLFQSGAAKLLVDYRTDALSRRPRASQRAIATRVAKSIEDFVLDAIRQADRAAACAPLAAAAGYLDARDLIHLGVHSQTRRFGGVFLSHRGQDSKRALMDALGTSQPNVFLDIWGRPQSDTNRRYLWRNMASAQEMHVFVTDNYAASDFCMKEVEAWGLLNAARGYRAKDTHGLFTIVGKAPLPANDRSARPEVRAWTQHRTAKHPTLERAVQASLKRLRAVPDPLGMRVGGSRQEQDASDSFNQSILASGFLRPTPGRATPVMPLVREPAAASAAIIARCLLGYLRNADRSSLDPAFFEALERAEAPLMQSEFASPDEYLAALSVAAQSAIDAINVVDQKPGLSANDCWMLCGLHIALAISRTTAWVARGLVSSDGDEVAQSLLGLTKFGATLDAAASLLESWIEALVYAGVFEEEPAVLSTGLMFGLLPIDHSKGQIEVRIDETFSADGADTATTLTQANLDARTITIICTATPHRWQRVATIAALSSFTSRNFLFVDVAGSGALNAKVGDIAMSEFPHVTIARPEDMPRSLRA